MMNESDFELVRGSGNVFRDFDDPHADLKQAKAILAARIIAVLDERNLTVRKAADMTGFAAADFSRIRNANLGRFTLDRLMKMLAAPGWAHPGYGPPGHAAQRTSGRIRRRPIESQRRVVEKTPLRPRNASSLTLSSRRRRRIEGRGESNASRRRESRPLKKSSGEMMPKERRPMREGGFAPRF